MSDNADFATLDKLSPEALALADKASRAIFSMSISQLSEVSAKAGRPLTLKSIASMTLIFLAAESNRSTPNAQP